jgi:hypothetical protein
MKYLEKFIIYETQLPVLIQEVDYSGKKRLTIRLGITTNTWCVQER